MQNINTNKCVTVVNVDDMHSITFDVEIEGKLPLIEIKHAFALTRVQLANEPGILGFDIYGISNVPFKFGDTVYIRGVPVPAAAAEKRFLTNDEIDQLLDQKLKQKLGLVPVQ